jgi:DNA polymerase III epsilon subunit-like protein
MDFKLDPAHKSQPSAVQVAFELFDLTDDGDQRLMSSINVVCVPEFDGRVIPIPKEASNVHGISDQLAGEYGLPQSTVLAIFNNYMKLLNKDEGDRIVAHNMSFDYQLMMGMYRRENRDPTLMFQANKVCTMKSTMHILNLPGRYGNPKWPSLDEAYRYMVNPEGFEVVYGGAHDALVDVKACRDILWALEDKEYELIH